MTTREAIENIPEHLRPFIAVQDPSLYTPMDHASWRYILRVSKAFFAEHAHSKYLKGLEETGISTERIPLVSEMDAHLKRFGWRAVPVSGFIPPAAFMEFQSLGILPIACEMRTLEHLAYTPAPDIVHEAAGHAPILADPEYAAYLRHYGEVSRRAIFSRQDIEVYEAIRELSEIKENPNSSAAEIARCQTNLDNRIAALDHESEATLLSRMNWWTVEYGLVGPIDQPKIYGAGLLSSIGESFHCLSPSVQKIPLGLGCTEVSYDITRPQPQLFVTPTFEDLTRILDAFANTMAFKRGGIEGLEKAQQAGTVTTTVLETGIQISGVLASFTGDSADFVRYTGPVQLSVGDEELKGQGADYHKEGFSSPIGPVAGTAKHAGTLSKAELELMGFRPGRKGTMRFDSGIELEGEFVRRIEHSGTTMILAFGNCTIRRGDAILFRPEWGMFDLACGSRVVSVFGGPADRKRYLAATAKTPSARAKPKTNLTEGNRALNLLYARIRKAREDALAGSELLEEIGRVHHELESRYPADWLSRLEILELLQAHGLRADWEDSLRHRLEKIAVTSEPTAEMITRGLGLL